MALLRHPLRPPEVGGYVRPLPETGQGAPEEPRMATVLPPDSSIRVIQSTKKPLLKDYENLDQLLVLLPSGADESAWSAVPRGARLSRIARRRDARTCRWSRAVWTTRRRPPCWWPWCRPTPALSSAAPPPADSRKLRWQRTPPGSRCSQPASPKNPRPQ